VTTDPDRSRRLPAHRDVWPAFRPARTCPGHAWRESSALIYPGWHAPHRHLPAPGLWIPDLNASAAYRRPGRSACPRAAMRAPTR